MSQFFTKQRCLLLTGALAGLSILPALSLAPGTAAFADPPLHVNTQGVRLPQAGHYTHPQEWQIVKTSPSLVDCRPTEESAPNYVISIPPQGAPQAGSTIVLSPQARSVAPIYRGSNIGSGGFPAPGAGALPAVKQGGLAPQDKISQAAGKPASSPRPILHPSKTVAAQINSYKPYTNSPSGGGFAERFDNLSKTSVKAALVRH